jgi:CrcB protein
MALVFVGLGGVLGVLIRYSMALLLPYGALGNIFFINVLGSVCIGFLYKSNGSVVWPMLVIGFCGGFTTFSTFALDTMKLFMDAKWGALTVYMIGMNVGCFGACWLGIKLRSLLVN